MTTARPPPSQQVLSCPAIWSTTGQDAMYSEGSGGLDSRAPAGA